MHKRALMIKGSLVFVFLLNSAAFAADEEDGISVLQQLKTFVHLTDETPDSIQSVGGLETFEKCLGIGQAEYIGAFFGLLMDSFSPENIEQQDMIDNISLLAERVSDGDMQRHCVLNNCLSCPSNDYPFTCMPTEAGNC